MTKLKELKIINDSNILYLKSLNKNCRRNEIIKNILDDDACFFKMNNGDAYTVLRDIGISDEEIEDVYKNLTCFDEFYALFKSKKIDLNDDSLLITYPIHEAANLFTSSNNADSTTSKSSTDLVIKKDLVIKRIINKLRNLFSHKKK